MTPAYIFHSTALNMAGHVEGITRSRNIPVAVGTSGDLTNYIQPYTASMISWAYLYTLQLG